MPVTVYKSTDGSAPVLRGSDASLVTCLDAILVNGYGAKSAAGWAKEFTGTGQAAYRAAAGARHRLQVLDQGSSQRAAPYNDFREARLRGFEVMSNVTTGTEPFPTTTQFASGIIMRKSIDTSATSRPWVCLADGKTVYFFAKTGDYMGYASFMFGEFFSLKSSADAYRSIIIGNTVEQIAATPDPLDGNERLDNLAVINVLSTGHFVPRNIGETAGSSVNVGKHGNGAHSTATLVGLATYPNPVDGGLHLSQVTIHHDQGNNAVIRGRLRGFWHFLHPVGANIADGDTWSGTGPLSGKTFIAIKPTANGQGMFVMETSDTWETN